MGTSNLAALRAMYSYQKKKKSLNTKTRTSVATPRNNYFVFVRNWLCCLPINELQWSKLCQRAGGYPMLCAYSAKIPRTRPNRQLHWVLRHWTSTFRRGSAAAWLIGMPEPRWGHACSSVVSVVCCIDSVFWEEPIIRWEWFSRCGSNCVWSRKVNHVAT